MLKKLIMVCSIVLSVMVSPVIAENNSTTCSACDGKISGLSLQYDGDKSVLIEVLGDKDEKVFSGTVAPNDIFTLTGFGTDGTLSTKVSVYIDGVLNTEIHTSCSVPLLIGMRFGLFVVTDGFSRNGGQICIDDNPTDVPAVESCGECDGKMTVLALQYNGIGNVLIEVFAKKGELIFSKNVSQYEIFTLHGFDKKETLNTMVTLHINGVYDTEIHTSCSVELLTGMDYGQFTIKDGYSRNGGRICTTPDYIPMGTLCGFVYEDKNLNGIKDLSENSIAGISVSVIGEDAEVSTVTTEVTGKYCAYNIVEGMANVEVNTTTLPVGTELISGTNPSDIYVIENMVNDAGLDGYLFLKPNAFDQNITIEEDIVTDITLLGEDKSGRTLTYIILDEPSYGTLSGTVANFTYTPNLNYNGIDNFTFKVNNGFLDSDIATVNITITPVNDAPIANDDNVTTLENVSIAIEPLLNDTDVDGNTSNLKIVSITQPSFGSVLLTENFVYYAPGNTQATVDQLTYTIEDEEGAQATATITINIIPVNEVPVAYNETVYTNEETPVAIEPKASDPDGDDLNYTIIYSPENGNLSGEAPNLTYTPNKDFNGNDYIAFTVNDGEYESYVAVVTIVVNPLNDPPVADAGEDYTGIRGDTIIFDASQSYDIDGEIISYEWRRGNEVISTEKIFEMQILEEGIDSVTLTVTDNQNASASDVKLITLNPCCEGCEYPDPTNTNPFN